MLRIEMLPALYGDCILIEYGDRPPPHRILVDGGTPETLEVLRERLARIGIPAPLDLLVVTHIDEDHIGGVLALLKATPSLVRPAAVWFNAHRHLFPPDELGAVQGEALSAAIVRNGFHWNAAFKGGSVVATPDGSLPEVSIDDARIVLLSPGWAQLKALQKPWDQAVRKAGLMPGGGAEPSDTLGKHPPPVSLNVTALAMLDFSSDTAPANGSSIAFLLEYKGRRVLLGADAHPDVLLQSLRRISDNPLAIDAWKVAHHGSKHNTSKELLTCVACSRYLISTNGDVFGHPDPEALAQIVSRPGSKVLCFNYETDYTRPWDRESLRTQFHYEIRFPEDNGGGIVLDL